MTKPSPDALGRQFLSLHHGPKILVLPNAWDAASARIFEEAGFPAVATSSAAIANSLGYPDGQRISRDEMLSVVKRIVDAVSVPVTADMEGGYGTQPEDVAETAERVIDAGAVGMNLEDVADEDPSTLAELNLQAEIIRAVCEVSQRAGVTFVLNARTDVFLAGVGDPASRLERTLERVKVYHEAGAQSLFVPGVKDRETIGRLADGIEGPLNILATIGSPPVSELEQLGVARISIGSGPMRATMGLLARIARQIKNEGLFTLMTEGAMTYNDANKLFQKAEG
jgi:2-methylisocitrate lyase-like PEP mutase family enzyme